MTRFWVSERGRVLGLCALVGLVALAVYAVTAQRGVSWQDSGIFQHRVVTGTYTDLGDGGLAVVHPWYLKSARLFCMAFPQSLQVYAVNLYSGVGMALAVTLVFILTRLLTGSALAAIVAAVTLGLTHMGWWLATIAEVYTWSLAFLFAELLCVLRLCLAPSDIVRQRAWCLLMFLNGMHASLHNVAFLNLPVYGVLWLVYVRENQLPLRQTFTRACLCAVCWLAGASLLVIMVVSDLSQTRSLVATLTSLLVGGRYGAAVMGAGGVNLRLAAGNMALTAVSFASPCWLCVVKIAKGTSGGNVFKRVLLALTVIQALFWVRYFVPDQATFVLPTLGFGAVWLGLGAASFHKRTVCVLLALGCVSQVVVPWALVVAARPHMARLRSLPFRDEARYWLVPWKHDERSAQRFAEEVEGKLGKGDVLIGDLTAVSPLAAARAAGMIAGEWRLVSEWSGESVEETFEITEKTLHEGGRVYVVSPVAGYAPTAILERFGFVREGVLWRMREKR